jgi:hypothetical protein
MNASFSSIQRMNRELGIDLERYFAHPTLEDYAKMDRWRFEELTRLVENIKARVQRFRDGLPIFLHTRIDRTDSSWAPWAPWLDSGLIDEVILDTDAAHLADDVPSLDRLTEDPHPFLAAITNEEVLQGVAPTLSRTPATGFLVTEPLLAGNAPPLPGAPLAWHQHGAVESHPVPAATALLRAIAEDLKHTRSLGSFFRRLHEFLSTTGEANASFEDLLRIRKDLLRISRKILDGDYELGEEQRRILNHIDQVARILMLSPVASIEY